MIGLYDVWREIQEMLNLQDEIRNKQKLLDKKEKEFGEKYADAQRFLSFRMGL